MELCRLGRAAVGGVNGLGRLYSRPQRLRANDERCNGVDDDDEEEEQEEEEQVWFSMFGSAAAARALISSSEIQLEETPSPGGRGTFPSAEARRR